MVFKRLLKLWNKEETRIRRIQDMTYYIENENFVDYPLCWQECSCSGRNDLIHYLNSNEKLFRAIVNIECNKRVRGRMTDILSIDGISSSQSPIEKFANLDEFASSLKKDAKRLFNNKTAIEFLTDNDFEDNCNFIKKDYHKLHGIVVQGWNNKKYILNSNCSHHLAAIYRQCKEQGKVYQLDLDIVPETIDTKKLNQLLNQYSLFFSNRSNLNKIVEKYDELFAEKTNSLFDYNRYETRSSLLSLRKEFPLSGIIAESLKKRSEKFLLLNDELERLYL